MDENNSFMILCAESEMALATYDFVEFARRNKPNKQAKKASQRKRTSPGQERASRAYKLLK
jgi:hypothetical protein